MALGPSSVAQFPAAARVEQKGGASKATMERCAVQPRDAVGIKRQAAMQLPPAVQADFGAPGRYETNARFTDDSTLMVKPVHWRPIGTTAAH